MLRVGAAKGVSGAEDDSLAEIDLMMDHVERWK